MRFGLMTFMLIFGVGLVLPTSLQAQFDDFESYASGTGIIGQGGWEGWDGTTTPDATVSTAQAQEGTQSLSIDAGSDVVLPLSGYDSGFHVFQSQVYIPSTSTGGEVWFILLNTYSVGGTKNWSTQILFDPDNDEITSGGGSGFAMDGMLPLVEDAWIELYMEVDLDFNEQFVYIDGALLASGPWQATGVNEVQAMDLFSNFATEGFFDAVGDPASPTGPPFKRGDADGNGCVEVADATFIEEFLFGFCDPPECFDAADADGDGVVSQIDAIFILNYTSAGGPPPPDPGPDDCGQDPDGSDETLDCGSYDACDDVCAPPEQFIRGDANGDLLFNGVQDAVILLSYAFIPGTPEPACLEALDCDDDGLFNGVADGIRLLGVAFIPGTPPMPPPYPGCGADDTPSLGCLEPPCP